MKKFSFVLIALSVGLFTTSCSFNSETSLEKSVSASKQLDSAEPAKVEIDSKPLAPSEAAKTPKPKLPATPSDTTANPASNPSNGKTCHKDEECNKKDELCVFSTCQSVSQLKSSFGFDDTFSNDPCEERPCADCSKGTRKKTGISYGYDEVEINASACVDCQFNDECNTGFRCVSFQCVDAATNTYCDFMQECLEGSRCEANKCVKETAEAPATN